MSYAVGSNSQGRPSPRAVPLRDIAPLLTTRCSCRCFARPARPPPAETSLVGLRQPDSRTVAAVSLLGIASGFRSSRF